jgi:hypothetical protein
MIKGYSFSSCKSMLKNKSSRVLAKNTKIESCGQDSVIVRLHGNAVVMLHESGKVALDSCGYKTVTTKRRMNQFLQANLPGYSVSQKKHVWYVSDKAGTTVEFADTILLG